MTKGREGRSIAWHGMAWQLTQLHRMDKPRKRQTKETRKSRQQGGLSSALHVQHTKNRAQEREKPRLPAGLVWREPGASCSTRGGARCDGSRPEPGQARPTTAAARTGSAHQRLIVPATAQDDCCFDCVPSRTRCLSSNARGSASPVSQPANDHPRPPLWHPYPGRRTTSHPSRPSSSDGLPQRKLARRHGCSPSLPYLCSALPIFVRLPQRKPGLLADWLGTSPSILIVAQTKRERERTRRRRLRRSLVLRACSFTGLLGAGKEAARTGWPVNHMRAALSGSWQVERGFCFSSFVYSHIARRRAVQNNGEG
ncbi:hypothetical protein IWZ01DRAFT_266842 [Phyllosticta capitalensis]